MSSNYKDKILQITEIIQYMKLVGITGITDGIPER